eukprot:tig00020960_g16601.t1
MTGPPGARARRARARGQAEPQTIRVRGGVSIGLPKRETGVWRFLTGDAEGPSAPQLAPGSVAEAIAGGESPFDVLPDPLVCRILFYAARPVPGARRKRPGSDTSSSRSSASGESSDSDSDAEDEAEEAGAREEDVLVRPEALLRLSHVSQRFRALAMEPPLWERLALPRPSDAAVSRLASLPPRTRQAVQGVRIRCGRRGMSYDALRRLHAAFRPSLEHLYLSLDSPPSRMPLDAVPVLRHFPLLRYLHLGTTYDRLTDYPEAFCSPLLQASLGLLSLSPALQTLELVHFPLTVAQLQTLERSTSLPCTLRVLQFSVYHDGDEEEIATIASLSKFTALERLDVEFFEPETGEQASLRFVPLSPRPTGLLTPFHLEPFAQLVNLKSFAFACDLEGVSFLRSMPRLEQASVNLCEDTDVGPLAAGAGTLKAVVVSQPAPSEAALRALCATLPSLRSLQAVHLDLTPGALEALAGTSLAAWGALRTVTLACAPEHPPIPCSILERLAMDVPRLERLAVASPVPLPEAAFAILAMPSLKRLRVAGAAAAALDEAEQESLRFTLQEGRPGLLVEFAEGGVGPPVRAASASDDDDDDGSEGDGFGPF